MALLNRLFGGFRGLLAKKREEHDLDEELRAYLDAAVDQKIAGGMNREDAIRAARREMGSPEAVKDGVRDAGWESHVESVWQDLRYALRGLRRSPGFATAAVLTLALGIGANSAIFSVVNGLLLRALPVAAPEELAVIATRESISQGFPAGWNYELWNQIRQRTGAFGATVAWTVYPERFDLAQGGETDPVDGLFVSWNFFPELGVSPVLGRAFRAEEDVLGGPDSRVAVISYGLWQRRFGGAADVVGRHIAVERVPVTIIGVAPPEFLGPEVGRAFEIALPVGAAPIIRHEREWGTPAGRSFLAVMLRLKPGQSMDSAAATLRGMQRRIIEDAMGPNGIWGPYQDMVLNDPFTLTPAATGTSELRRQYSRPLVTVLVIAALVLIIACANVANLLLARAAARQRELSVRRALGATRWRLARQTLVESLVLAGMGAAVGLLFALWGSRVLVAQLSTWFDRVVLDVSPDWRVMAFTSTVTLVTAVLFGTAPAIRASHAGAGAVMTDSPSGRNPGSMSSVRVRGALVVAQVALSVVLLVVAGLFIRTFQRIATVPLGFASDRVLVVDVNASRVAIDPGNRTGLYERLTEAVRAIPGVTHAATSLNTPVNHGITLVGDFRAVGNPPLPPDERRVVVNHVTSDWFAAYGIAVRQGRVIDARDTVQTAPVVVANEAFVRKFFPDRPAVGEAVVEAFPAPGPPAVSRTVIGVVSDSVDQSIRYGAYPTLYQPLAQWGALMSMMPQPPQISLSVRAGSGSPSLLARSVAVALTGVDRNLAFSFRPLADQVDAARHQERLVAWLSGLFGAVALLLAAIGLYGVTSYAVARRRAEIGIRVALGATRRDVVGLALRHTVLWTAAGVAVGLVAAAGVTHYLEAMLFGITPLDAVTFLAAPVLLAVVAGLAALLPAQRAATVDPMVVLRCE